MFRFFITLNILATPLIAHAGCFDFSQRVTAPLTAPIALSPATSDMSEASGALSGGRVWASAQGVVDHSTEDLLQDLLTHRATRAGAAKNMKLKTLGDAKNDLQQTAELVIKPVPLITVTWLEHWTYNVTKGSFKNPDTLVVAYEKTEGTSYIEHLCGTLKLQKVSAGQTRVTLYEEVKATRRTEKDTLNGVTGTLRELRDLKVAAAPAPAGDGGVRSGTSISEGVKSGATQPAAE